MNSRMVGQYRVRAARGQNALRPPKSPQKMRLDEPFGRQQIGLGREPVTISFPPEAAPISTAAPDRRSRDRDAFVRTISSRELAIISSRVVSR